MTGSGSGLDNVLTESSGEFLSVAAFERKEGERESGGEEGMTMLETQSAGAYGIRERIEEASRSTHFWVRYSSRMLLSFEADCEAAIDSCLLPTRAIEGDKEAARRRDEAAIEEIIVVCGCIG